jgi:hypothetical protein
MFLMWTRQIVRIGSTLGVVAALTVAAAPAAQAQGHQDGHQGGGGSVQRDDGNRGGADRGQGQQDREPQRDGRGGERNDRDGNRGYEDRDGNRGYGDRGQPEAPFYVVPQQPDYAPPVVVQPIPVPVTPDVLAYALPPLEALFPTADFADYPPQLVPVGNNVFALSSPSLFWGPDQATIAQSVAAQLAQSTPGWGTTVLNGPQGYGVYLTCQPYS